jgi:hypothetical protein
MLDLNDDFSVNRQILLFFGTIFRQNCTKIQFSTTSNGSTCHETLAEDPADRALLGCHSVFRKT